MVDSIDLSTLLDAREVPTPPTAALRVLEIKNDPDASMSELVAVVQQDPGLAVKIMTTANSPAYRRGDAVTTVDRAVSLIGFRSVTTIALAFSVASTMPSTGVVAGIPMTTFWTRSIVTAATARLVSQEIAGDLAEESFFVGLIAGLGRVVMGLVIPDEYEPLATEHDGWPTFNDETAVFDFSSATTTAALLRQWKMPELFADAADQIETVPSGGAGSSNAEDIARSVRLAMAITEFYVDQGDGAMLRELTAHALDYGISPSRIDQLLDLVFEHIEELAKQFGVDADVERYAEIVNTARGELVELSLQTDAAWREESEKRAELERTNVELEAQARQDPLTGLHNRRAFNEQLMQQVKLRIRNPQAVPKSMGVIMIDIDKFKLVNDTYGHDAGDAVLVKLAEILKMTTRSEETIARYGGEEFILLAPSTSPDELVLAGERIRKTIELVDIEIASGEHLNITASFGVATLSVPELDGDAAQLVKAADEALYEAKAAGRNRVMLSTSFPPQD